MKKLIEMNEGIRTFFSLDQLPTGKLSTRRIVLGIVAGLSVTLLVASIAALTFGLPPAFLLTASLPINQAVLIKTEIISLSITVITTYKLFYMQILIAFAEFRKPPISQRLRAINFDETKLPEKFFDNIVTMAIMDDPVVAVIDEPLSVKDFLPDGTIRGRHTYDRTTFKNLKKCPVSNRRLKTRIYPNRNLKLELLKIVQEAEAHFQVR